MPSRELTFDVDGARLSAILNRPARAKALFVLAHGAGAGMRHPFMEAMADALADERIATFRFPFPYTEAGKRRPDSPAKLAATIVAAVGRARRAKLPLFAGGKSMGGRITSLCAARGELGDDVRGLVFLGFPLHAANAPDRARAEPLREVTVPMCFVQGARDPLADLVLLRPIAKRLGASLLVVPEGDHSFAVPRRSGRSQREVIAEVAAYVARWIDGVLSEA